MNALTSVVFVVIFHKCSSGTSHKEIELAPTQTPGQAVFSNYIPFNYGIQVFSDHGPEESCGGTINLTEPTYIVAPDLEDLDCRWRIIAPKDHQILVRIMDLNLPNTCYKYHFWEVYCGCSFIEMHDGDGPSPNLVRRLCGATPNFGYERFFNTYTNVGYLRFFLRGSQSNAFNASITPIYSSEVSICGTSSLTATQEPQFLTSPEYPKTSPYGKCKWIINTQNPQDKIELHFLEMSLNGSGNSIFLSEFINRCLFDSLEIVENPDREVEGPGFVPPVMKNESNYITYTDYTLCGVDDTPFDYHSMGSSLILTYQSFSYYKESKGFKLQYRIADCNKNHTNLQGRLVNYNKQSECFSLITVPENRTISLYFLELSTPSSASCKNIGFEVREGGPLGTLLLRSCGFIVPDPIFSTTNQLYIKSSMAVYDVLYTSTDAGRGCGGEFLSFNGLVASPFYPEKFSDEKVCQWTIRVPSGLHAALRFVKFDLVGSCEETHITVTTYSDRNPPTCHKFCKERGPGKVTLESVSSIEIKYVASAKNNGTRWLAKFQGLKGGTEWVDDVEDEDFESLAVEALQV